MEVGTSRGYDHTEMEMWRRAVQADDHLGNGKSHLTPSFMFLSMNRAEIKETRGR
jgi:hypothetical protein